ncbi:MAG: hypothetical protein ACK41Q_10955 [Candidatus Brocadia sp.]
MAENNVPKLTEFVVTDAYSLQQIASRIDKVALVKGIIGGTFLVGSALLFSNKYLRLGVDSTKSSLRLQSMDRKTCT